MYTYSNSFYIPFFYFNSIWTSLMTLIQPGKNNSAADSSYAHTKLLLIIVIYIDN